MAEAGDGITIAEDQPTNLAFVFKDGKKMIISEHFYKLSQMLQDYRQAIQNQNAAELPVQEFTSKSYEILVELLKLLKTQDPLVYSSALEGKTYGDEPPAILRSFFDELDGDERIEATNFCAYVSMDFAKRYFVWYFATVVRDTAPADVRNLSQYFGSTPLDENDLKTHGIIEETTLWQAYPEAYESIMGRPFAA